MWIKGAVVVGLLSAVPAAYVKGTWDERKNCDARVAATLAEIQAEADNRVERALRARGLRDGPADYRRD